MTATRETVPYIDIDPARSTQLVFDPDQQYFTRKIEGQLPKYEIYDRSMHIRGLWGEEVVGEGRHDQVLIELARHRAFQRLIGVEQNTLPRNYATISNTTLSSRWEHIWDSLVLVRKLAEKHNISEEDSIRFQLRTLLSDVGHTAFSHEGDWTFQKAGSEDLHDKNLSDYLEQTGVNTILRNHGIDPAEVIFPDKDDWVESKMPNLCVDRLDYGLREIRRWVPGDKVLDSITADDFGINETGHLYFKDEAKAKAFAHAYLELGREHWSEPTHRLQLSLHSLYLKRVQIMDRYQNLSGFHPRSRLYSPESYFKLSSNEHDGLTSTLDTILRDTARFERTFAWLQREERVRQRLGHYTSARIRNSYSDFAPHHVHIAVDKAEEYEEDEQSIRVDLPKLKVRLIDPLVKKDDGEIVKLSEIDEAFSTALELYKQQMLQRYIGRIGIPDRDLRVAIKSAISETNDKWKELLRLPDMTPQMLNMVISLSDQDGVIQYKYGKPPKLS